MWFKGRGGVLQKMFSIFKVLKEDLFLSLYLMYIYLCVLCEEDLFLSFYVYIFVCLCGVCAHTYVQVPEGVQILLELETARGVFWDLNLGLYKTSMCF